MLVTATCGYCSRVFEVESAEQKRGNGRFCGLSCSRKHQLATRPKPENNAACSYCGKEFYRAESKLASPRGNGRFCCRAHKDLSCRVVLNCKACGASLTGKQRKYCTSECQKIHSQTAYIAAWKDGKVSGNCGSGTTLAISDRVRKYLHKKHGSKCCRCGWSEVHPVTGLVPLTVNHINGDHTDSREENVELICPNCHALTLNYGNLNIGHGRKLRHRGTH